jgi:hypothetical protein
MDLAGTDLPTRPRACGNPWAVPSRSMAVWYWCCPAGRAGNRRKERGRTANAWLQIGSDESITVISRIA